MQDYTIDDFNPCRKCTGTECGLLAGQECDMEIAFQKIKNDYFDFKNEVEVTRRYIKENNLEWDLMSFMLKRGINS